MGQVTLKVSNGLLVLTIAVVRQISRLGVIERQIFIVTEEKAKVLIFGYHRLQIVTAKVLSRIQDKGAYARVKLC